MLGTVTWTLLITVVPLPWSVVVMTLFLALYWQYFRGWGWPKATTSTRKTYFRSITLTSHIWKWGLIAAILTALFVNAAITVAFRIVEFPDEALDIGIQINSNPKWMIWIGIIMASVVAGVAEETGFRGYMQVPIERRYGPIIAIIITTIMFILVHLTQAWVGVLLIQLVSLSVFCGVLAYASHSLIPSMIGHTLFDIFAFSYWWSDLLGSYKWRPISETGVDAHFIGWTALLVISLMGFIWVIYHLGSDTRKQSPAAGQLH